MNCAVQPDIRSKISFIEEMKTNLQQHIDYPSSPEEVRMYSIGSGFLQ